MFHCMDSSIYCSHFQYSSNQLYQKANCSQYKNLMLQWNLYMRRYIIKYIKDNNNEKLTIGGVTKFTTNNTGIFIVPKVTTYRSPNIIYTYFNTTIMCSTSTKSNSTILTWSYKINDIDSKDIILSISQKLI